MYNLGKQSFEGNQSSTDIFHKIFYLLIEFAVAYLKFFCSELSSETQVSFRNRLYYILDYEDPASGKKKPRSFLILLLFLCVFPDFITHKHGEQVFHCVKVYIK